MTTTETATHSERCCMEGAWPGWGPHPDCPGVEALNEVRRQDAATAATPMTSAMVCGPVGHDWQPAPGRGGAVHAGARDEGLTCSRCGVTEAELDAMEHGTRGTYDEPAF